MSNKRLSYLGFILLEIFLVELSLTALFFDYQLQTQPQGEINDRPIYYGEHTPPWYPDFSGTATLEAKTGKSASIVMGYTQWNNKVTETRYFNRDWFDQVRAHGSIPMLTWEPWTSLKEIYSGKYDDYIKQWAQDSKDWDHPYFLRFAHEMNAAWYPWSEQTKGSKPGDYVQAWRHVHDIFSENHVTNVTWIWCPNVEEEGFTPITELYPGDEYVDWTCMDGYNFGGATFSQVFEQTYKELLEIAPTKPIMIGETNSIEDDGKKPAWITDALTIQLPQNFPKIKALVWYDNNFNGRKDWVVNSSTASLQAFKAGIASSYYASNAFGDIDSSPIRPIETQYIPNAELTKSSTTANPKDRQRPPTPILQE